MFSELDIVILKSDLKEYRLKKGDVGTVVQVYEKGKAYEVEFVNNEGETLALVTLKESDVLPVAKNKTLHVPEGVSV